MLRGARAWCLHRQGRRCTVRRVAAHASGGCCRDGLPPRAELLMVLPIWTLCWSYWNCWTDYRTAEGPYFIPLPLGYVRASWRRSGSCACWLASACIGVQATEWRTAVYKNCLGSLRGVCWPRSMPVRLTVIEEVSPSVWLWEVPTKPFPFHIFGKSQLKILINKFTKLCL
jgi:hypothetical protein